MLPVASKKYDFDGKSSIEVQLASYTHSGLCHRETFHRFDEASFAAGQRAQAPHWGIAIHTIGMTGIKGTKRGRPSSKVRCPPQIDGKLAADSMRAAEMSQSHVASAAWPSDVHRNFEALIDAIGEIGRGSRDYELNNLFLVKVLAEILEILFVNSPRIPG